MKPDSTTTTPARNSALRAELVALASESEAPRRLRYPVGRVALGSMAAFALAGATTGGAVAATGVFTPTGEVAAVEVVMEDMREVYFPGTEFFGAPLIITGSGTTIVDLGDRPEGATSLALRVGCLDPGRYDITLDDQPDGWVQCDDEDLAQGPPVGGFSTQYDLDEQDLETVTVAGDGGDRYVIWVSWAALPERASVSAVQQEALADGEVTRAEYEAGLDRYVKCMADLGWSVGVIDRDAEVIDYRIEAIAGADDALCYVAEFEQIDMAWQLSREDG